jgi:hypothetical protein
LSVDDQVKDALKAIKASPNSKSEDLPIEASILRELHASGYITAATYQPLSGDQVFANVEITIPGERYLESLNSSKSAQVNAAPHWYTNPFLIAGLTIVSGVAVLGIAYVAGWN